MGDANHQRRARRLRRIAGKRDITAPVSCWLISRLDEVQALHGFATRGDTLEFLLRQALRRRRTARPRTAPAGQIELPLPIPGSTRPAPRLTRRRAAPDSRHPDPRPRPDMQTAGSHPAV